MAFFNDHNNSTAQQSKGQFLIKAILFSKYKQVYVCIKYKLFICTFCYTVSLIFDNIVQFPATKI